MQLFSLFFYPRSVFGMRSAFGRMMRGMIPVSRDGAVGKRILNKPGRLTFLVYRPPRGGRAL